MRKKSTILMLMSIIALTSCEKAILAEEEFLSPSTEQEVSSAKLNIVTSAKDDSGDDFLAAGTIFVFNSNGKCVKVLSTDEGNNQFNIQLPAGSYTLYAVAGEDLSRFDLPDQSEATPNSIISRIQGKAMDDFLWAETHVDLKDGESASQNIILQHQIISLDEIEIKQVPLTATNVEVTFSPIYSAICLNGTFPNAPTESYTITLSKAADGTTWKASQQHKLFPSKGKPTIKVSITTNEGTRSFAYNSTEVLEANHHFTIIGTYHAAQGVSLTGLLMDGGWGEDRVITFDLNDNAIVYNPVEGEWCNGYYVVSVNESQRKAVLLSLDNVHYDAPTEGAVASDWEAAFVTPMVTLEKPIGINSNWRLPTLDEAEIITKSSPATHFNPPKYNSPSFFCLDENILKWAYTNKDGDNYTFKSGSNKMNSSVYLRPVIDLAY